MEADAAIQDERAVNFDFHTGETVLAGACARLVAQTILHPLDVIRTRSQTKNPIEATLLEALPFGLAPQMLLSVPAGSIQFAMVKYWRTQIEAAFGDRCTSTAAGRFFTQLFAAAGGAACAGSVRIPQEVVKQGCMAEMYPNAINAVQTIAEEKGVAGFYKGAVGNFPCTPCLAGETTIEDSATNSTGCVCESSRYLGIH